MGYFNGWHIVQGGEAKRATPTLSVAEARLDDIFRYLSYRRFQRLLVSIQIVRLSRTIFQPHALEINWIDIIDRWDILTDAVQVRTMKIV